MKMLFTFVFGPFGVNDQYLKTGKEIFDICCKYEDKPGITDFGVPDENFLKSKDRSLELLDIMEREERCFTLFDNIELVGARFIFCGYKELENEFIRKKIIC